MKLGTVEISTWASIKCFISKITQRQPDCEALEKSRLHEATPPPYRSSADWRDDVKIPHLPPPTFFTDAKANYAMPARPFPKDWKTCVGPQRSSLKSSNYCSALDENQGRRF